MSDIVVYTAITNNADTLKQPPIEHQDGIDFVAFLDNDQIATPWQIRKAHSEFADPCRNAKRHKILPHVYFPEKTYSLWMDGSVRINFKFPIARLIEEYLKECDLVVFMHPERQCIYEEAETCIRLGKDDPATIQRQMACYRNEGYPAGNGLVECAVLLRRHTEKVRQFNEAWYHEIKNHSRRDQLSFNYVAQKVGLKFRYFPGSLRNEPDDLWHILPHRADELAQQAAERERQAAELAEQAALCAHQAAVLAQAAAQMIRLLRRKTRAERFALGFGILASAWIAAGLVLIYGGGESRPALHIFWQLWPLVIIPLCGVGVCWFYRLSFTRRIKAMESRNDA